MSFLAPKPPKMPDTSAMDAKAKKDAAQAAADEAYRLKNQRGRAAAILSDQGKAQTSSSAYDIKSLLGG